MSEPRFTDTEILDWLIAETNRHLIQFDKAHEHSWFDVQLLGGHALVTVRPGVRINRSTLEDYMYRQTVSPVIKKLLK